MLFSYRLKPIFAFYLCVCLFFCTSHFTSSCISYHTLTFTHIHTEHMIPIIVWPASFNDRFAGIVWSVRLAILSPYILNIFGCFCPTQFLFNLGKLLHIHLSAGSHHRYIIHHQSTPNRRQFSNRRHGKADIGRCAMFALPQRWYL